MPRAGGGCELCEAARLTTWYHEDDVCWVADCEICAVPMVVWRTHGTDPPEPDREHMWPSSAGWPTRCSAPGRGRSTPSCARSPTTSTPMPVTRVGGCAGSGAGRAGRRMGFADRARRGGMAFLVVAHAGPADRGSDARARRPRVPVVMGMARGGVPVAFEVAGALGAPLDVVVVRKLGHPRQPELGLGAIAEDGVRIVNDALVRELGVPEDVIDAVAARQRSSSTAGCALTGAVAARAGATAGPPSSSTTGWPRGSRPGPPSRSCDVGMRPGSSWPCRWARPTPSRRLREVADDVVCVETTEHFFGLSEWYEDFRR